MQTAMNTDFSFHGLTFSVSGDVIRLKSMDAFGGGNAHVYQQNVLADLHISGQNRPQSLGSKQLLGSEGLKLRYVSHCIEETQLTVLQRSELVEVQTLYERKGQGFRVSHKVTNRSQAPLYLDSVPALVFHGLSAQGTANTQNVYLYRFYNSWHVECQPRKLSLFDCGLFAGGPPASKKRISGVNTGSWSSKEELPQAIIEDTATGQFLMFQIESCGSWYWEIGEWEQEVYLLAGGPNRVHNQWSKRLEPGQSFQSIAVAFAVGDSLNQVLANMTTYRREIAPKVEADSHLPVIFNEYMHLSWDNPCQERTRALAPSIKALGGEYYVIDCGWHNEEDSVYNYVGHWKESKARFPDGIKATLDHLRSLGLKPGLWIEPESFGYLCQGMDDIYDGSCFFTRNGKPVINMGRKQLDFRSEKVRGYMTSVLERMILQYGVEYIKIDYNQDCGDGTELDSSSPGDGLLEHTRAYCRWLKELMERYPWVLFENCGSGGCRMDYQMLSLHPLQSTSDQTDYRRYPYIAGNMLSALLPEQAGVWSYPCSIEDPTAEDVIFNMVNSFLGRIHLASDIRKLDQIGTALVAQGIRYYNALTPWKKQSVPYLPLGFTDFSQPYVTSGFFSGGKLFLAVWNLEHTGNIVIPLDGLRLSSARQGYPDAEQFPTDFKLVGHTLTVRFDEPYRARFFELT